MPARAVCEITVEELRLHRGLEFTMPAPFDFHDYLDFHRVNRRRTRREGVNMDIRAFTLGDPFLTNPGVDFDFAVDHYLSVFEITPEMANNIII